MELWIVWRKRLPVLLLTQWSLYLKHKKYNALSFNFLFMKSRRWLKVIRLLAELTTIQGISKTFGYLKSIMGLLSMTRKAKSILCFFSSPKCIANFVFEWCFFWKMCPDITWDILTYFKNFGMQFWTMLIKETAVVLWPSGSRRDMLTWFRFFWFKCIRRYFTQKPFQLIAFTRTLQNKNVAGGLIVVATDTFPFLSWFKNQDRFW